MITTSKLSSKKNPIHSKCSFLDDEAVCKHEVYSGKRVKRGLFRSNNRNGDTCRHQCGLQYSQESWI